MAVRIGAGMIGKELIIGVGCERWCEWSGLSGSVLRGMSNNLNATMGTV